MRFVLCSKTFKVRRFKLQSYRLVDFWIWLVSFRYRPIVWPCVLFLAVMWWTVSRTVGCPSGVTPSDCPVLTWTRVCTAPAQPPPPPVCLVSTCTVNSKPIPVLTTSTSVGKHCNQICYLKCNLHHVICKIIKIKQVLWKHFPNMWTKSISEKCI